ncbi:MAG: hypothetical protein ACKO7B_09420, partial [Flavobacteriales bacterium]
ATLNPPAAAPGTGVITTCAPDSTVITAQPINPSDPIHWYDYPGGNILGSNSTLSVFIPDLSLAYDTLYYAVAGTPGCESVAVPLTIHVQPRPASPSVTSAERCGPGTLTLQASSPYPITWYDISGNIVANDSTYSPTLATSTDYFVGAFDGNCMSLQSSVSGTINSLPVVTINGPDTILLSSGQLVTLGTTVFDGTGPYNYSWSPAGQTTSSINVFSPATYAVTVTDGKGCSG